MKKLLLIILFFLPISAFAWADTDRICADTTKWGDIYENITLAYPGENAFVHEIWKKSTMIDGVATDKHSLYYVVELWKMNTTWYEGSYTATRSELYTYDCDTKTPTILLRLWFLSDESGYSIDFISNDYIVIVWRPSGMENLKTSVVIGYDIKNNKKLFTYKNSNRFMPSWTVKWIIQWSTSWFLYFNSLYTKKEDSLYSIDKKTKKITQL